MSFTLPFHLTRLYNFVTLRDSTPPNPISAPKLDGELDQIASAINALATSGGIPSSSLASNISASKIADGSVSNAEFQRLGGVTSSLQTQLNGKLSLGGGDLTGPVKESKGSTIDSAATVNLSLASGNFIDIAGTASISAFGNVQAGGRFILRFLSSGAVLNHNAVSLIIPGSNPITVAAGDVACVRSLGSGNWIVESYTKANGYALLETAVITDNNAFARWGITAGSANAYTVTVIPALSSYLAGTHILVQIHTANTGASTVNVAGLGIRNIKKFAGSGITDLAGGNLETNGVYLMVYDGTQFITNQNPRPSTLISFNNLFIGGI